MFMSESQKCLIMALYTVNFVQNVLWILKNESNVGNNDKIPQKKKNPFYGN